MPEAFDAASEPPAAGSHAASPRVETADVSDPRWDSYVAASPRATFFHRAGWQRVAAATFPYRPAHLWALRGERVVGILPLFEIRGFPWGRTLVSVPLGVYGGVAADDEAGARALLAAAKENGRNRGARYIELRGGARFEELPAKDLYVTFRKELDPDPEVNMARIPRNQRRSIRIALKNGLEHRLGREDLLGDFYRIYSHSVRNLGSPVFPKSLFANLLVEFGDAATILGVFREGVMVGGVFTFFDRGEVLPYYGGALKPAFKYAVNDFMYWSLMGVAAERGCRVFDFGRSKKGSGSYHFKRHWGFEPMELAYQYDLVRDRAIPDLSPRNPRFSLAIRVWRRLPLAVTERVGPILVRFFP